MKICPKCNIEHNLNGTFCSRQCANSRGERTIEFKNKISKKLKGRKFPKKKGKTCSEEKKKKLSDSIKKYYENNPDKAKIKNDFLVNSKITEEGRKRLSIAAKKKGFGGYQPNSIKKHKKGLYKDYWCDSSWELAFVIYNLEQNIIFKRNTEKFQYEYKGKKLNWIPDFILEDNSYIEIKGYYGELAKAKENSFPYKLEIIEKEKIKKYLDYVINNYGKDFIKLYASVAQ